MGCVVSLGCYAPNEECSKVGMERGLFAVLFEVGHGSICVRGAADMIKEWRMVYAGVD